MMLIRHQKKLYNITNEILESNRWGFSLSARTWRKTAKANNRGEGVSTKEPYLYIGYDTTSMTLAKACK